MSVKILYFASLREQLACDTETLDLPAGVHDVAGLRQHLVARGGAWAALAGPRVRAAVNQQLASPAQVLGADDEVAFFPPVTGG